MTLPHYSRGPQAAELVLVSWRKCIVGNQTFILPYPQEESSLSSEQNRLNSSRSSEPHRHVAHWLHQDIGWRHNVEDLCEDRSHSKTHPNFAQMSNCFFGVSVNFCSTVDLVASSVFIVKRAGTSSEIEHLSACSARSVSLSRSSEPHGKSSARSVLSSCCSGGADSVGTWVYRVTKKSAKAKREEREPSIVHQNRLSNRRESHCLESEVLEGRPRAGLQRLRVIKPVVLQCRKQFLQKACNSCVELRGESVLVLVRHEDVSSGRTN